MSINAYKPLIGIGLCLTSALSAQARPVSYPDAWTLMVKNDSDQNSIHAHYTIDTQHSLGLRLRYDREGDFLFTGVQANRLMKRWNKRDSQANIYGRIALGLVQDEKPSQIAQKDDEALFLGVSGDWETRRYFVSASAEYWDNGQYGDYSSYHGRLGIAPYIANTGALHTWLMIEAHNRPESQDKTGASAIVRLFKGPSLLELGVDDKGEPLINYIHRF
ncbi:hypothetical protein DES40_2574 [Litorimonas taeanensis]|uniref:Uncharacterized protein n=1 Tax=Litorimonas taeanensis TaxID=568099 RepID=A0A420WFM9_9PROT|nr:hypothetical protein [Litorimonas taeanensis]RKQ69765.1 hypothetical protein DES40_2574 [Litorimonas taeanensis]